MSLANRNNTTLNDSNSQKEKEKKVWGKKEGK
jgi:hypothetical protein